MSSKKRSVRFTESSTDSAEQQLSPPQKRSRPIGSHNDRGDGTTTVGRKPSALRPSSHKVKNNNRNRANEDELDDIDDWNEREDGDIGGGCGGNGNDPLPSQSQLIEAKRKRRQQRGANGALFDDDDDDNNNDGDDHLDATEMSLATDGVKIEPFHMREEETDGTGYFDGDTYVFRKNPPVEDGEADAWADTLMRDGDGNNDDGDDEDRPTIAVARRKVAENSNSATMQEDLDVIEGAIVQTNSASDGWRHGINNAGHLSIRKARKD